MGLSEIRDIINISAYKKEGFNAGVNGETPRTYFFGNDELEAAYYEAYELGLRAAEARLASKIGKNL